MICLAVFSLAYKLSRRSLQKAAAVSITAGSVIMVFALTIFIVLMLRTYAFDITLVGTSTHAALPQGSYIIVKRAIRPSSLAPGTYIMARRPVDRTVRLAIIVKPPEEYPHADAMYMVSYQSPFDENEPLDAIPLHSIQGVVITRRQFR